jgi:hypothetical protein
MLAQTEFVEKVNIEKNIVLFGFNIPNSVFEYVYIHLRCVYLWVSNCLSLNTLSIYQTYISHYYVIIKQAASVEISCIHYIIYFHTDMVIQVRLLILLDIFKLTLWKDSI